MLASLLASQWSQLAGYKSIGVLIINLGARGRQRERQDRQDRAVQLAHVREQARAPLCT